MTQAQPARSSMTVIGRETQSVLDGLPVQPGRIVTKRILKADGARLVLMALDAGQELTEHTASVPILIQLVAGKASVTADDEEIVLGPGGSVHIDTRVPHAVHAHEASHVLLVLLGGSAS